MLEVRSLEAGYGPSQVLFGVSFDIRQGEVVTLLGRNGMGKTTTVHALMGIVPAKAGTISYQGEPIARMPSYKVAQKGIGLVPEGRQVFPNLTVYENLIATAANRAASQEPWSLERVYELFPQIAERMNHYGNQLSGGEQQMLAIGRALMTNPRLLILDEATEGLAPLVRQEIYRSIEQLKSEGLSLLVIDKDVRALTRVADRHYVLEKGRVVWSGSSTELAANRDIQQKYLGV